MRHTGPSSFAEIVCWLRSRFFQQPFPEVRRLPYEDIRLEFARQFSIAQGHRSL
jgi:hypothetical protein